VGRPLVLAFMITPLPFTWPYGLLFWPVYVWAFIPEFRLIGKSPLTGPSPPEDRGSLGVVLFAVTFAIAAAFVLAFAVPQATINTHRVVWFFLGVSAIALGSLLRRHCFRVLGAFFTGAVTVQAGHQVIDRGAYRWVRHPSYSAALLLLSGIGMALGNWLSLVVLFFTALAAYTHRSRIEEKALLTSLGDPYRRFMSSRKRFIPFIY
jgi:protein-S-isoprenylcysteine O-methyltransferase Ste14